MPQRIHREVIKTGLGEPIVGANSVAFTENDAVYIDGSGFTALVTTSSLVYGVARQTVTMAATNQTVALVKVPVRTVDGLHMLYGADQAATATDRGAYADFGTITTGAQVINLAAGTSGQMHVLGFNLNPAETATTDVVVEFSEWQKLAYAQQ